MTKYTLRLAGEDSSRAFETEGGDQTVESLAKQMVETGFLLGRIRTSERLPEPEEVAIPAAQVKWISLAPSRQR